jgi:hypothetical protein
MILDLNKYPPAEPEVLRLLAPQRGLTAIGHSQNPNTGDGMLQYPGNVKLWESPRQSRGFSPINNELEVIRAFFARGIAWAAAEASDESARLAQMDHPDEETIERVVTHPHAAEALEQIIFRSVVNELNSLYEFALQQVWIHLYGLNVPVKDKKQYANGEAVFVSNRQRIEIALSDENLLGKAVTDVKEWQFRDEILEIKELAEGFKHRQRLQPLPKECYAGKSQDRAIRRVDPDNSADENPIAIYGLTQIQISHYLDAVAELLRWLGAKKML